MIKMITFNNLDTKPNAAKDEKVDAATQDFTAILNGFSTILPSSESFPPDVEIDASPNLENFIPKSPIKIEQTETVFAPNADPFSVAKHKTNVFGEEINIDENQINQTIDSSQKEFLSIQPTDLYGEKFSDVQIDQTSKSNEIDESNFSNQMPMMNEMNKQYPANQAANMSQLNDQDAPKNLKFFVNEEIILDLPENLLPTKSPDTLKEKSIFDVIKSNDENVEILSVKSSNRQNLAQNELKDFFQNFRSESTSENQIHATNSIKQVKPRANFSEISVGNLSDFSLSENKKIQTNLTPQIVNPPPSFLQESVQTEKNIQIENSVQIEKNVETPLFISPNSPTSNQIELSAADRPIPKPDKSLNISDEFVGLNFDKFLNTVSKNQEIIEVVPNSLIEDKTVFKQLEPKIVELATSLEKTGEKQLLKMRLNPAELGEVEIRLEKNSSGKIYAHIRTENEAARHILVESLGELRNSLQNSGWQIEKLEVSCNPFSSGGNERGEDQSRQTETRETERSKSFGLSAHLENEGETRENPAQRLISLRA